MKELSNYYKDQLSKVDPKKAGTYAASLKISHETASTNWLGLNDESANEIYRWLSEYYNLTEDRINKNLVKEIGRLTLVLDEVQKYMYAKGLTDQESKELYQKVCEETLKGRG